MAKIDGHDILKIKSTWLVDGRQGYLSRDGLSIVAADNRVLAYVTPAQVKMIEDEDKREVPQARRSTAARRYDNLYNEGGEGYNPYRRSW